MNKNFSIEKKLEDISPDLHNRFVDCVATLNITLNKFSLIFPNYTDHSIFHSLDVLEICNQLLADNIQKLNVDECYILCMASYMHDVGMGISKKDYFEFTKQLGLDGVLKENEIYQDIIRKYHNEYSGCYIKKYAEIFEIPDDDYVFSIVQVSRGHRKTDLFDETEYPNLLLKNGNTVHLSYLSAIIRLADELDVTIDRNPSLQYDFESLCETLPRKSVEEFTKHETIKSMDIKEKEVVLNVSGTEYMIDLVGELVTKIQETLDYCRDVVNRYDEFKITQEKIIVKKQNY